MSISSVITLGYGQGVNFIPTLGYLSGAAPVTQQSAVPTRPDKEGHSYVPYSDRLREEEYQRSIKQAREEVRELEEEIALAEERRKEAAEMLATAKAAKRQRKAAKEAAALEAMLQQEIEALRKEQVRLMRFIDDEETALVLLLSLPLF